MNSRNIQCLVLALLSACAMQYAAAQAREESTTLTTASGNIVGTLALPTQAGKGPVALIISGSGPTDRDGNGPGGRNDSLTLLAAALAQDGVATLRFDKRGIGASRAAGPAEAALRFDTYVDDAAQWIAQLQRDPRFASVLVIGHSEGSLIGMLAAERAHAAAFVSIAGPAQSAPVLLRRQLAGKLPPDLAADNERILASLTQGDLAAAVPPALAALYRPGVQPYLISWFKYVPAERLAQLTMPVLILQGTTDIQVGVEEATALKAANPRATLAVIPGMNHVLKLVPAEMPKQVASYGDPALPLAPQLVVEIRQFVRGLPH